MYKACITLKNKHLQTKETIIILYTSLKPLYNKRKLGNPEDGTPKHYLKKSMCQKKLKN